VSSRFKRKGKSKFLAIEGHMYRSAAYQSLTPNEKVAYQALKWRYNGFNNGFIGLGERELAAEMHVGRDTARRALQTLIERGFIAKAKPSGFNRKDRVATEWRLTELNCDITGELATKDFTRWRPTEKTTGASQVHTGASQVHMSTKKGVKYA
jgi:DNA-binding MarR family transcriptional regulator